GHQVGGRQRRGGMSRAGLGAAPDGVHPKLGGEPADEAELFPGHHRAPFGAPPASSCKGAAGSASLAGSTGWPERTRAWMASVTSQTLTFMPASTRPALIQKAMNSPLATSP